MIILAIGVLFVVFYVPALRRIAFLLGIVFAFYALINPLNQPVEIGTPNLVIKRLNTLDVEDDPRLPLWRGAIRAANASNFLGLGLVNTKHRFPEFYKDETIDWLVG